MPIVGVLATGGGLGTSIGAGSGIRLSPESSIDLTWFHFL